MKQTITFFISIIILICICAPYSNAKTIIEIIPDESRISFDEYALSGTDPSGLIEQLSFNRILEFIIEIVKDYLPDFFKLIASVLVFVLFFALLDHISFTKREKSYHFIISCLASSILTLFLFNCFSGACTLIEKNIKTIRIFCDASVPVIAALLIQGGKNFSSAFFSYGISLSGIIINSLNDSIFMPLIKIFLAIGCCGCIWEDVDFSAITDIIEKFIKWLIGIVFSIFTFTLSMQNILASSADNAAQKVLKNAASGVPYMGGVLSKGIDGMFVIASGTKNASSIVGIAVIGSIFIGPALILAMQSLALYFSMSAAKFFGQKDCLSILKTVHKAYLLMLSLFLVSVLMCLICFLVICLGAN